MEYRKSRISLSDVWEEMRSNPHDLAIAAAFDAYGWSSNALPVLEALDPLTALGQTAYILKRYGSDLGNWKYPIAAASFVEETVPFLTDWVPITIMTYGLAAYLRLKRRKEQEQTRKLPRLP